METTTTNNKKPSINSLFSTCSLYSIFPTSTEHFVCTIAIADSFLTSSSAEQHRQEILSRSYSRDFAMRPEHTGNALNSFSLLGAREYIALDT